MNENWEICAYVDYCDGPIAEGVVPPLWYRTNYNYRWQVLLDVFSGSITYGRVGQNKLPAPAALIPASIPGAISVSMAFDSLAKPIFAVGILDGTIQYYNFQAGFPRLYVRPGTNPRLWYNGLLTEYARSEVVSFSSNAGVLEMRFQRNNYSIPYLLPTFPYPVARVTKTDAYLPENRQYLYVLVGEGRNEKGYLIRSSGYPRYLVEDDHSLVHQEMVGRYREMAPVQEVFDANRVSAKLPFGQYIFPQRDRGYLKSGIISGMYLNSYRDNGVLFLSMAGGLYQPAIVPPIQLDRSLVFQGIYGLYFPAQQERSRLYSSVPHGTYYPPVVSTVADLSEVRSIPLGLYVPGMMDAASIRGTMTGEYANTIYANGSDRDFLKGRIVTGDYHEAISRSSLDAGYLHSRISGESVEAAGITWANQAILTGYSFTDVAYGDGLFVVVGSSGTSGQRIVTSEDGTTWTPQTTPTPDINLSSVIYGNGIWVAISSSGGSTLTSTDGVTWTVHANVLTSNTWQKVTYGNGLFVAVNNSTGSGSRSAVSTDGVTWSSSNIGNFNWLDVAYGAGLFVAVSPVSGANNQIATSPDGLVWTARTNAGNIPLATICFENGQFVALNQGGQAVTSEDGITWTSHAMGGTSALWDAVCGTTQGLYIAVGQINTNRVTISLDGATWTQIAYADGIMTGVAFGNGLAVAVSQDGHISTSGTIGT